MAQGSMKKTREAKKVLALATSQLKKKEYLSLRDVLFMTYPDAKLKAAQGGLDFNGPMNFAPSVKNELINNILVPYAEQRAMSVDQILDGSFADFVSDDIDEILLDLEKKGNLEDSRLLGKKVNAFIDSTKVYDEIVEASPTGKEKALGKGYYNKLSSVHKLLKEDKFPTVIPFGTSSGMGTGLNKINRYFERVNILELQTLNKMKELRSQYGGKQLQVKGQKPTKIPDKIINELADLIGKTFEYDAGKDLTVTLMATGFRNGEALSLQIFDDDVHLIEEDKVKGEKILSDAKEHPENLKKSTFRRYVDGEGVLRHHIHIPSEVTKTGKMIDFTAGERLSKILEKRATIAQAMGAKQLFAIPSASYNKLAAKRMLGIISKIEFDAAVKNLENPIEHAFTYGFTDTANKTIEGKSKSTKILNTMFGTGKGAVFENALPLIAFNEGLGETQSSFTAHAFRRFFATYADDYIRFNLTSKGDADEALAIKSYLQGRFADIEASKLEAKKYKAILPYKERANVASFMDDFLEFVLENAAPEGETNLMLHHVDKTTLASEGNPQLYNSSKGATTDLISSQNIDNKKTSYSTSGKSVKNFKVKKVDAGPILETVEEIPTDVQEEVGESRRQKLQNAFDIIDDENLENDYRDLKRKSGIDLETKTALQELEDKIIQEANTRVNVNQQGTLNLTQDTIVDINNITQDKINSTRVDPFMLLDRVDETKPDFRTSSLEDMQRNLEIQKAKQTESIEEKLDKKVFEDKLKTTTLEDVLESDRKKAKTLTLEEKDIVSKTPSSTKPSGFMKAARVAGKALPFVGLGVGIFGAKKALGKDPSEFALTEDESLLKSKARQYSRAGAELLSGISPVPLDLSILNLANPLIPGEKYDVEFKTLGEKIAPTVQERAKDKNLSKQMDELNFK